jgi:hypothetical protein
VDEWRFGVSFSLTFRMLPFGKVEGGALKMPEKLSLFSCQIINNRFCA